MIWNEYVEYPEGRPDSGYEYSFGMSILDDNGNPIAGDGFLFGFDSGNGPEVFAALDAVITALDPIPSVKVTVWRREILHYKREPAE